MLFPKNYKNVTEKKIEVWLDELEVNYLILRWAQKDCVWGIMITWEDHQRIRSTHKRRTPKPPEVIYKKIKEIKEKNVNCCQLTTSDRLNLNPNLNPNLNLKTTYDQKFELFWNEYPKKISKKEAHRIWTKKIKPDEKLFEMIMSALKKQKTSIKWNQEDGKYINHPTTWLNQERWNDQLDYGSNPKKKMSFNEWLEVVKGFDREQYERSIIGSHDIQKKFKKQYENYLK